MTDEFLRLAREQTSIEAELIRTLGRTANMPLPIPEPPSLTNVSDPPLNLGNVEKLFQDDLVFFH